MRAFRLRLALRLVRSFSLPHLAAHRLRTALTVVGVALGVATIVGIADVSESLVASFRQTLRTVAGDAELEVTSAAGRLPEDAVGRVAAVSGVAAAAGVIEAFVPLADHPTESLYLLGIDFLGSPLWEMQFPRDALEIEDEMIFLAQPDSVAVTRTLAERFGLRLGDPVRVIGPAGPRVLRVRGILGDVPVARLFGGLLVVMDLPAAGLLLDRGATIDRVAVRLAEGGDRETTRAALAAAMAPAATVAVPEERGDQADALLFSLRAMLGCMSFAAAIVGALIVYHAVAVSRSAEGNTVRSLVTPAG